MHIVFAHDGPVFRDDTNNIYTGGSFHQLIWNRYLSVFDEITVAIRFRQTSSPSWFQYVNHPTIRFVEMPNLCGLSEMLINTRQARKKLTKLLEESNALIARLPSEVGFLSVRIASRIGIPWAVEIAGCPFDAYFNHGMFLGKLYAPFALFKLKTVTKKSRYTLYVTSRFLQKRYPSFQVTSSCSNVEIPDCDESILKQRLLKINSVSDGIITIGFIGGLFSKYKNLLTAIKAVSLLKARKYRCILRVLGAGDTSPFKKIACQYRVDDITRFEGALPAGNKILHWLDDIDIYIHPSLTEGLPRSAIEAMSRACPIAASGVGGLPELIDDAFLHKPKDVRRLADIISRFIDDKSLCIRQATVNFNKSKNYTKSILDEKRSLFWNTFKNDILKSSGE